MLSHVLFSGWKTSIKTQASVFLSWQLYPVQRYRQVIRNKLVCCSWILSSLPTAATRSCKVMSSIAPLGPVFLHVGIVIIEKTVLARLWPDLHLVKEWASIKSTVMHLAPLFQLLQMQTMVLAGGMFALLATDTPQQIFIKAWSCRALGGLLGRIWKLLIGVQNVAYQQLVMHLLPAWFGWNSVNCNWLWIGISEFGWVLTHKTMGGSLKVIESMMYTLRGQVRATFFLLCVPAEG